MTLHLSTSPLVVTALLLLLSSFALVAFGLESCTTCQFQTGAALSALDFGGQSSLVLSTDTSHAIQTSETPLSFTIEAWVWVAVPNLKRPQPIFARYPQTDPILGDSRAEFLLQLQANGNLNLMFGGGSADMSRHALNLDCGFHVIPPRTWTHVALSVSTPPGLVNPNFAKVYINGLPACEWPGTDAANTTFAGSRQVLHDQPFVVSLYQLPASCDSEIYTLAGQMDELRVWAGARSDGEIFSSYDTVDLGAQPNDSTLVGLFHMDRDPAEEAGSYALDSSSVGANAQFAGLAEGDEPEWVPSDAPVSLSAESTNFLLAQLTFYIFAANENDTFGAEIDVTSLQPYETVYLDSGANVPVTENTVIPVAAGADFPIGYFYTTSMVSYRTQVRYRAVSYNQALAAVYSDWSTITITVTASGCDGQDSILDHCGVCGGVGDCAPYGCDGEGLRLDDCGVCGGDNQTCRCDLANWRGYDTPTLDKSVLYYDLAHLEQSIADAEEVMDEVTDLLLNGDFLLSCQEYSEALAMVELLQTKASIYNNLFLEPFLEQLS